MHSAEALVLYPGVHQEDHWALIYDGAWDTQAGEAAELGGYRTAREPQSEVAFTFSGTDLWLKAGPDGDGSLSYSLDGQEAKEVAFAAGSQVQLARALSGGSHTITIRATPGPLSLDSLTIRARDPIIPWLIAGGIVLSIGVIVALAAALIARRRRWYQRSRVGR
jgi:cytochrome c biogenesis protein ResB